MSDTIPSRADSSAAVDRQSRPLWAYGLAAIATLLAALAWFFPSPDLAGIVVVVVALSSFGMTVQLGREKAARDRSDDSRQQSWRDAARVEAFLRNVRDGVHIVGTDGRLVDASDSFFHMLGMRVTQWDAKRTPEELDAFLAELFADPRTVTFETRHRRKDGSTFDVEIYGCPVEMTGQRVLFHSARDISDRKVLEDRYRDIYQSIISGKKDA
jgi:PAS domain S-box-containing protein